MHISNRTLIAILVLIALLSAALGGAVWLKTAGGTRVAVTVDGKEYGTYSLYTDRTIVIQPEDGSWHNTLTIHGGRAAITESDCANQICVNTPALQEDIPGVIVCLPHGVVVQLK